MAQILMTQQVFSTSLFSRGEGQFSTALFSEWTELKFGDIICQSLTFQMHFWMPDIIALLKRKRLKCDWDR